PNPPQNQEPKEHHSRGLDRTGCEVAVGIIDERRIRVPQQVIDLYARVIELDPSGETEDYEWLLESQQALDQQ
ncbi:MAG: hypothetical protein ACTII7_10610, partial [Galactobacter sp.]